MAPKQQVCAVIGRVVHVSQSTETVEFQGASIETQSCYLEDNTGTIKLQLWESLIGKVAFGCTYKITNVSTRVFAGSMYLTTSRQTEVEEVAPLVGLSENIQFTIDEGEVIVLEGSVTSVEVAISRRCVRCQAWQQDVDTRGQFHRCFRCKRLQYVKAYQPTVNASVTFVGDFGDRELTLPNSVIKRYVERENLSDLLNDAQDFEEHLMMNIVFKMSLQRDVVICMEKVPERSTVQCMHPDTGQMEGSDAELIAVESGDVEVVAVRVEGEVAEEEPEESLDVEDTVDDVETREAVV